MDSTTGLNFQILADWQNQVMPEELYNEMTFELSIILLIPEITFKHSKQ